MVQLAKVACITPVTNAWPERGASAVKRIKLRTRSTMKNDLLNGLMLISINGPKANSSEAEKMIKKACLKVQQTRRNKRSNVFVVRTTLKVASTQTVEVKDEAQVELEEAVEKSLEKESDKQFLITNFDYDFSSDEDDSGCETDDD